MFHLFHLSLWQKVSYQFVSIYNLQLLFFFCVFQIPPSPHHLHIFMNVPFSSPTSQSICKMFVTFVCRSTDLFSIYISIRFVFVFRLFLFYFRLYFLLVANYMRTDGDEYRIWNEMQRKNYIDFPVFIVNYEWFFRIVFVLKCRVLMSLIGGCELVSK